MDTFEYTKELTSVGLDEDQAMVYEALVRIGEKPASKLALSVPLSRTLVYKVLDELIARDLVEKKDAPGAVATFSAKHPAAIRSIIDAQKEELETAQKQYEAISGTLSSLHNLSSGKPGVEILEGIDGIEKALNDTLAAQETVYMYVDSDTVDKEMREVDARYVAARHKKGVKKRILMAQTEAAAAYAREHNDALTEIKLVASENIPHFYSVMNIYDKKVSYITYKNSLYFSTIIHDESVYTMHRFLFEALWQSAR